MQHKNKLPNSIAKLSGRGTSYTLSTLNLDEIKPEGFRIKVVGNNLLLSGNDDSGTEFAVYTFLAGLYEIFFGKDSNCLQIRNL